MHRAPLGLSPSVATSQEKTNDGPMLLSTRGRGAIALERESSVLAGRRHVWSAGSARQLGSLVLTKTNAAPSLRINRANRNHHLWLNNGVWWIHLTFHVADFTKRRIRRSLGTANLELARRKRDELLSATDFSHLLGAAR